MRYLVLLLIHLCSIAIAAIPALYFIGAWFFPQNLIGFDNILLAGALCILVLPMGIGILSGFLIDGLSNFMRSQPFYDKSDWSRCRRRTILLGLVSAALMWVHYTSFA